MGDDVQKKPDDFHLAVLMAKYGGVDKQHETRTTAAKAWQVGLEYNNR